MNSKTLVLLIAALLIAVGLFKPDLGSLVNRPQPDVVEVEELLAPFREGLKTKADEVVKILKDGDLDRKTDGKRLASLYVDLATLVALDGDDEVIKNTEEIRQSNRLAGTMLKLDMKNKYPKLGEACKAVIVEAIGDDSVALNKESRIQAAEGFKALAWACLQGSK
jgi:hypothetical protein